MSFQSSQNSDAFFELIISKCKKNCVVYLNRNLNEYNNRLMHAGKRKHKPLFFTIKFSNGFYAVAVPVRTWALTVSYGLAVVLSDIYIYIFFYGRKTATTHTVISLFTPTRCVVIDKKRDSNLYFVKKNENQNKYPNCEFEIFSSRQRDFGRDGR